jgi:hypothetical protein
LTVHFIPAFLGISLTGIAEHIVEGPFYLINSWLHSLYIGLANDFEKEFVHTPIPTNGPWQDYLYGSALGLSEYLTSGIFIIMAVAVTIFSWHGGLMRRVPRMFSRVIVVILAPTFFFWLIDRVKYYGDQASVWASQIVPTGSTHLAHSLLYIPAINNPLGSIAGLVFVAIFGGLLWLIVIVYQGIAIVATFLALPFFVLSIVSDRALRVLNWLISLFIVSAFAGRPVAILCMQLGKAASEHLPLGNTVFGSVLWVVGSLLLAIAMQGILIWACLTSVSYVTGNVHGRVAARVRGGNVNAKLQKNSEGRRQAHRQSYGRSFHNRRGSHNVGGFGKTGSGFAAQGAQSKRGAAVVKLAKLYPGTAAVAKAKSTVDRAAKRGKPASANGWTPQKTTRVSRMRAKRRNAKTRKEA